MNDDKPDEEDFYKLLCLFILHAWYLEDTYPLSHGKGPDKFKYNKKFRDDFAVDHQSKYPRRDLENMMERATVSLRKVQGLEFLGHSSSRTTADVYNLKPKD